MSGGGPTIRVTRAEPSTPSTSGIKTSTWFITVSTNQRPKNNADSQRMADALGSTVEEMLNNPQPYIKFREKGHAWNTHVLSVDSTFTVELGPEAKVGYNKTSRKPGKNEDGSSRKKTLRGTGGRIHAHIILKIQHKSKIYLDAYRSNTPFRVDLARGLRERGVEVEKVYVDIKLVSSPDNLLRYLSKDSPLVEEIEKLSI